MLVVAKILRIDLKSNEKAHLFKFLKYFSITKETELPILNLYKYKAFSET